MPESALSQSEQGGRAAGTRIVRPGGQLPGDGSVLSDVLPQGSRWIPRLLQALLQTTAATVRELVHAGDLTSESRLRVVNELLLPAADVEIETLDGPLGAEVLQYYHSAADYALRRAGEEYGSFDQASKRREAHWHAYETLTRISTGQGPASAGVDALEYGPAALFDAGTRPPVVTLMLDGQAWTDVAPETVERSLNALSALAHGIDLRLVVSPDHEQQLQREHADWLVRHDLTETEGTATDQPTSTASTDEEATIETAWNVAQQLDEGGGRLRLIATLDPDDTRSMPALRRDPEIELTAGTLRRYVPDLEADGLVRSRPFGSVQHRHALRRRCCSRR